jgi:hypothetical protein
MLKAVPVPLAACRIPPKTPLVVILLVFALISFLFRLLGW